MKTIRTWLTTITVLLYSLTTSAHDFEVDGIYYNVISDKNVEVTYPGEFSIDNSSTYRETITIPSTVTYENKIYSVTSIGSHAFVDCILLTSINIPESVVCIGESAFSSCLNITSVTIPNSVTSIGKYAFSSCARLASITIPNSVTSIGEGAFSSCGSLTSITIPNSVTSIGSHAFVDCRNLTSITIPNSVTSIGEGAFAGCRFTSITIPNSVTSIGEGAFNSCYSLKTIVVAEDNDVFDSRNNCNAIIEKSNNRLIVGCSTTIIPESVISIGENAFSGHYLPSLTIPNSVISIGSFAFQRTELTSIFIPKNVISIGEGAFSDCNITSIVVAEDNDAFDSRNNCNAIIEKNSNRLIVGCYTTVIPESVTSIGESAFFDCIGLTSITIPESVTSIGESAFSGCGLTSINIPESVTSIEEGAFSSCIGLTSVTIPESVTSIEEGTFEDCRRLPSITIPNSVTNIGESAFASCTSLTSITIPESVTNIGEDAFLSCYNLTFITIPNSVTSIGEGAFSGCRLTSIVVAEDNDVFDSRNNCNAIIEKSSNSLVVGCSTTIIPESVISIGESAFDGCYNLTSITIPESVTSIGKDAFHDCSNLQEVLCYALNPPICDEDAFKSTYFCTLYVPNLASVESYKVATGWKNIEDIKSVKAHNLTILLGESMIQQQLFDTGDSIIYPSILNKEGYTLDWNIAKWEGSPIKIAEHADDMLYTNAPCTNTSWGDQFSGWHVLVDGQTSTFFHSEYNNVDTPDGLDHYIRVDLGVGNEVSAFSFSYTTRPTNAYATAPTTIVVEGSNEVDGVYTVIDTLTDLPTSNATNYESELLIGRESYRYIRFRVTATGGGKVVYNHPYFTMSEFGMKRHDLKVLSTAPEIMPDEDLIITGLYSINKYLITFKIGDEVIVSDSLEYGAAVVAPEAPEKEGHTFNGWGEVADSVPANDLTYEGSYTVNSYLLTYTVDGDTVQTDSVTYSTSIKALEEPVKEGYTFSGWSEVPDSMPANDVTIIGTFTINTYLVTFKIGDEVIAADSLIYGAAIVVPDAPEREGYTFDGWGEVAETVPAGDVTYEGSYSVNSYILTYEVDGITIKTDTIDYGTAIEVMEEPVKEGYTFSGWSEIPASMPAYDVTVSGVFAINKYLVTFKIGDEVIASDSLEYGASIVAPDAPEREGYTFDGWGEVAKTVPAGDVTYEGSYTANTYKVYYYVGEELVHTAEVTYGEAIPEYVYEPTEEGYTFLGWIGDTYETMPAHDVTYTANIDNAINELTIDNGQLTIYDLTGRKVINTENLKGGIYIVNGRKLVIK